MSVQETNLKAIADAIREKDGTTDPIPAADFPDRILAIPSGGALDLFNVAVNVEGTEYGSVKGAGLAEEGMTVVLEETPINGNSFDGWYENSQLKSVKKLYVVYVDANKSITAKFVSGPLLFDIFVSGNNNVHDFISAV